MFAADDEFGSAALDLSQRTAARPTQQTMQAMQGNVAAASAAASTPVQHSAPAPEPEAKVRTGVVLSVF